MSNDKITECPICGEFLDLTAYPKNEVKSGLIKCVWCLKSVKLSEKDFNLMEKSVKNPKGANENLKSLFKKYNNL